MRTFANLAYSVYRMLSMVPECAPQRRAHAELCAAHSLSTHPTPENKTRVTDR